MDWLFGAVAAAFGAGFGVAVPLVQHRLYTEPEFRAEPVSGRKLRLLQVFAASSAGVSLGLAFRPDRYEIGPALLTAGFLLVLVTLASTDFDRRRIPNKLTYPAALAAAALCWVWPDRSIADIAIGACAALVVAAILVFLRFGGGDSKLVVLIGLLVGWPGVMPAILYGVVLGGLVAFVLLFVRGRGSTFAYGPYLAVGAAIVMLFPGTV